MSYKPKHCCQCGATIDRIDWKPWTSRRFCELCETEFGIYDWLPRGLFGIGLLLSLFSIGNFLQKNDKPLSVASKLVVSNAPNNKNVIDDRKNAVHPSTNNSVQSLVQSKNATAQIENQAAPKVSALKTRQTDSTATETSEIVYFCGATTKKGTMCSRRVKGGGRCWQHEGQAAMLPPQKLKL